MHPADQMNIVHIKQLNPYLAELFNSNCRLLFSRILSLCSFKWVASIYSDSKNGKALFIVNQKNNCLKTVYCISKNSRHHSSLSFVNLRRPKIETSDKRSQLEISTKQKRNQFGQQLSLSTPIAPNIN